MFDVAPTEMLVVAAVALVVIGPKDLPKAMRFVGKWVGKARGMARHFRSGIDTMMRESELAELEQKWRANNDAVMTAYPDIISPFGPVKPGQGNPSEGPSAADATVLTTGAGPGPVVHEAAGDAGGGPGASDKAP